MQRMTFEVYGRVQGVYFRRYTVEKANELKLVGWVQNTTHNTVKGIAEGLKEDIEHLKHWLKEVGSPNSHVTRLKEITTDISSTQFQKFVIVYK